jgi:multiple sugar transport system permease protein
VKLRSRVAPGWYVVLAAFLVVTLFPIYWMLVTSLKSFQEVYTIVPTFWPKKAAWANYVTIFSEYGYGPALVKSVEVSLVVSLLSVPFAFVSSYAVVRMKFPGRRSMPRVFLLSYLIPQTILFIPIYILLSALKLTNSAAGLMFVYPTMTLPYATWVFIAHFANFPVELEEAAFVDGATRLQTIVQVIVPPSIPTVVSTFIFSFTICWSEYIYALVIINNKTQRTITLALSNMLVADIIPWGPLMAGAVIAAVPIMMLYMAASRYIVGGLTLGSVKG